MPRFHHAISAVEPDSQALHPAGGEKNGEQGTDRERSGMRCGQHIVNFPCDRYRRLLRPGRKHQLRHLVGEIIRAKDSRERGQHNKERKHRHQRGKSDVARNRPTVVSEEVPVSVDGDVERSSHRSVNSRMGNPNPSTRYPKHSMPFQVVNNAATIVQTRGNVRDGLPWRCFCALHA